MKKIISLIIAATLILALCPMSFATDNSDGYKYVFAEEAYAVTMDRTGLAEMTDASLNLDVTDSWKAAGSCYLYTVTITEEGLRWNAKEWYANGTACFGVEISVSEGGTYIPSLTYYARPSSPIVDIYLVKEGTQAGSYGDTSKIQFAASGNNHSGTGNYIKNLDAKYKLKELNMWAETDKTEVTEDFDGIELELEDGKYYLLFSAVGKNDDGFVPVTEEYLSVILNSFKLTPAYTAETYTPVTPTVTALAAYGDGEAVKDSDVISVDTAAYGQKCNVSVNNKTVEKNGKTYNFLYWAKGLTTGSNKLALSTSESFDYMPQDGNNVLIAVYEEADAAEETATFYNANGQLLTDIAFDGNTLPALPSMAGYTAPATAWVQLGTNTEYAAGADVSAISGDKIFMAKYADSAKKADISVTVNGNESEVAYGAPITCTPSVPDGQVFMYWKKTVGGTENTPEIVSMDENYSFYAWEDCVVTAVYGDAKPSLAKDMRKIIISNVAAGNETAIMAEFIGFEDALEKGVMVGSRKIAMTSDNPQFTVVTDDDVTGYAIVGNATDGYTQITDK